MNIVVNEKTSRFEMNISGQTAFIDYRWSNGVLVLAYIFVPVAHRGQGYSDKLIHFALDYAREKDVKIRVLCSHMAHYLNLHPEMTEGLV